MFVWNACLFKCGFDTHVGNIVTLNQSLFCIMSHGNEIKLVRGRKMTAIFVSRAFLPANLSSITLFILVRTFWEGKVIMQSTQHFVIHQTWRGCHRWHVFVKVQSHYSVCITYANFRKCMQISEKKLLIRTAFEFVNPSYRRQSITNVWLAHWQRSYKVWVAYL